MGHLGGKVLAGVGLGSILCGSTNWVFGFLSVLTIPRVAAAMAKNKPEKARLHIAQGLWVGLTVGLVTMTAILCFAPNIVGRAPPPSPCHHAVACFAPNIIAFPVATRARPHSRRRVQWWAATPR